MALYKVILAYDGTDFSGSQKQKGKRTVQGVFEEALATLGWKGSSVLFAGRTDAGVHASGQVAAFTLDWKHGNGDLLRAMNSLLPRDVAVRSVEIAPKQFHPRYDAVARMYRYRVIGDDIRNPLIERFAWRIPSGLNFELLQQAACYLPGKRDFSAFGSPVTPNGTTVREVFRANWEQKDNQYLFEISANAFLYHMVRHLVFTQILVGQGRLTLEQFANCLKNECDSRLHGLAPSQGLTLVEVQY